MDKKVIVLSASDFEGQRLNKSIFTNINEGYSAQEIEKAFPTDKFVFLTKSAMDEAISKIMENAGGEIKKGGFNDTSEINSAVQFAKEVSSLTKIVPMNTVGGVVEICVVPKIIKSKSNVIEKAKGGEEDVLEKGVVTDSLLHYGSNNQFTFKKNGAQIKEKLSGIKTVETAKLAKIEANISELSEKLNHVPNCDYSSYENPHYQCKYKTFKYDMTYKSSGNVITFSEFEQGTLSDEEIKNNSAWNDLVYSFREVEVELKSIELLEDSLEDDKEYELTARQMLNFGF